MVAAALRGGNLLRRALPTQPQLPGAGGRGAEAVQGAANQHAIVVVVVERGGRRVAGFWVLRIKLYRKLLIRHIGDILANIRTTRQLRLGVFMVEVRLEFVGGTQASLIDTANFERRFNIVYGRVYHLCVLFVAQSLRLATLDVAVVAFVALHLLV